MTLSKQEARAFLEKVLKISSTSISQERGEDRTTLLNLIVKTFQQTIPYQSVTACAVPPGDRHLPTWSEIKQNMFNGIGGLCYPLHVFMKELLSALDFNVIYVCASGLFPNDRITIIASDVSSTGSKHLVEVGCGYPTFQAIPLDFETESPEYVSGFLLHKFVKTDGVVRWLHEYRPKRSFFGSFHSTNVVAGWYRLIDIQVNTPRDLSFFEDIFTPIYTSEESNKLIEAPRMVSFANGNLLAILADQKIIGNDKREIIKAKIDSKDQLLALYEEYFPTMERSQIENAIKFSSFTI